MNKEAGGWKVDKKGEQEKSNDKLQGEKLSSGYIIFVCRGGRVPLPVLLLWPGGVQIQGLIGTSSAESNSREY